MAAKEATIGGWLLLRLTTLTTCALWAVTALAWATTTMAIRTVLAP